MFNKEKKKKNNVVGRKYLIAFYNRPPQKLRVILKFMSGRGLLQMQPQPSFSIYFNNKLAAAKETRERKSKFSLFMKIGVTFFVLLGLGRELSGQNTGTRVP